MEATATNTAKPARNSLEDRAWRWKALAVAHVIVLVAWCVVTSMLAHGYWSYFALGHRTKVDALGSSLAIAQSMLLAYWLALGDASIRRRFITTAAAVAAIVGLRYFPHLIEMRNELIQAGQWPGYSAAQMLVMSFVGEAAAIAARAGALILASRWLLAAPVDIANSPPIKRRRLQISILGLLILLFLLACEVASVRYLITERAGAFNSVNDGFLLNRYVAHVIWRLGFYVSFLVAVWAVFGRGDIRKRLVAALVLETLLTAALTAAAWPAGQPFRFHFATFIFSSSYLLGSAITVASLLFVRAAGHRPAASRATSIKRSSIT